MLSPSEGEKHMSFRGIADSDQITILRQALDDYCAGRSVSDEMERENIATRIVGLFHSGMTTLEDLVAALENSRSGPQRLHQDSRSSPATSKAATPNAIHFDGEGFNVL